MLLSHTRKTGPLTAKKTTDLTSVAVSHPDAPKDFSALAMRAVSKLCADKNANAVSAEAQEALGDPIATAMAYALCDGDACSAEYLVDALLDAGLSVEDVCLDHLAPAARRLGDWWDANRLPFTEVTVATARIQALMRRMPTGGNFAAVGSLKGAVFGAVPGEQHTLGVIMAADMFRRNGWEVGLLVGQTHADMAERLGRDDRAVIGLSCSGTHSFMALKRLMQDLRKTRPDAQILVSGQIVDDADRMAQLPQPFTAIHSVAEAETFMVDFERALEDSTNIVGQVAARRG